MHCAQLQTGLRKASEADGGVVYAISLVHGRGNRPDSTYLDTGEVQNSILRATPTEQKTTPLLFTLGQGETASPAPGNCGFLEQECYPTRSSVSTLPSSIHASIFLVLNRMGHQVPSSMSPT